MQRGYPRNTAKNDTPKVTLGLAGYLDLPEIPFFRCVQLAGYFCDLPLQSHRAPPAKPTDSPTKPLLKVKFVKGALVKGYLHKLSEIDFKFATNLQHFCAPFL